MTALTWIKERTERRNEEALVVEGVTYDVTSEVFSGHLPRNMIRAATKESLEVSDTVNEVIAVHAKSGFTEYSRTVYTPRAA